jgi:hypothetical protein
MKSVVVIGSGLAGTLVSNDLVGDHDVSVLEIGRGTAYDYPSVTYSRKPFGAVKTFCYGAGGTTNLWHNGLIPMRLGDISSDTFVSVLRDAEHYADRSARDLFYPGEHFTSDHERLVTRMNELSAELGAFPTGMDCLIYPKSYRSLSVRSSVKAHYSVSNIGFEMREGKVARVLYEAGSKRGSIEPDFVVVCAGALGSPSVVSTVLETMGLSTSQVGDGLTDHPMGFVGKVKFGADASRVFNTFSGFDGDGYQCCTAARLENEGYYAAAFFRPALTMQNRLEIYKYKSRLGASSGLRQIRAAFSPRLFHPDVLAEVFSHLFHTSINSRVFNILLFFEQKRGNCSVRKHDGEMIIDWGVSDDELAVYNRMLESLRDTLAPVSEQVEIEIPISEDWLWSGAHHSGTIPMGDRGNGVVDTDLRMNECENVFVCDASIIQEHSYTNTGLTIGQLAHRVADSIRGA